MRILLLAVLVLVVSGFDGCTWPWDHDDDKPLCNSADCAAKQ